MKRNQVRWLILWKSLSAKGQLALWRATAITSDCFEVRALAYRERIAAIKAYRDVMLIDTYSIHTSHYVSLIRQEKVGDEWRSLCSRVTGKVQYTWGYPAVRCGGDMTTLGSKATKTWYETGEARIQEMLSAHGIPFHNNQRY